MADAPIVTPATPSAAPLPGTPEYDAAMIAKFDNVGITPSPSADEPAPKPAKPEGVPDKFWNAEKGEVNHAAWAKSTAELEAALTKSKQQPQTPPAADPAKVHADGRAALQKAYRDTKAKADVKPEEIAAAAQALADYPDAPAPQAPDADKIVSDAGFKLEDLRTEYQTQGALTDASYAKLEKAGIDRGTVDAYIAGQVALAGQRDAEGFAIAGGQENYSKMTEWAKTGMTAGEVEAFNKAVISGTVDEMKLAVSGLHQRYAAANGSAPVLLGGDAGPASAGGYRSHAEMVRDMRNPLYQKDPAFREDVMNKIARTTAF